MTTVTIRPQGDDDIPSVCDLFRRVFQVPMTERHWRWKYLEAPALSHVNMVAQDAQGRLVGHVGATVWSGSLGEQPLRLAHACDVMVCPSVRGGLGADSVYRRLMGALDAAVRKVGPHDWPLYLFGFPGQTPARLGERMGIYRRLGICHATRLDGAAARPLLRSWWRWMVEPLPWDVALTQHDALCRSLPRAPADTPVLFKDATYLRWRYAQHPDRTYQYWGLRRHWGRMRGWIVTRQQPGVPYVVDGALPSGASAAQVLAALGEASGRWDWHTWWGDTGLAAQATPIVAVEFSGCGQFHPQWRPPLFQPGDTDVF